VPEPFALIRPALRLMPPEAARDLTIKALAAGLGRVIAGPRQPDPPILAQRLFGLDFPNPVGLAAGYDKDGEVPDALLRLGFGFVEIGTVTPHPQPGNPKPRVFRLDEEAAVINRMGFNSSGLDMVAARLSRRQRAGIVGLNLGKNRDSTDPDADYLEGVRRAAHLAEYLAVNVSSPNTPGLRELQARAPLERLLRRLNETRAEIGVRAPLLLKIAPDLTAAEREDIAEVALAGGIDGLIVSNTTIARPLGLRGRHAGQAGGLSGRPLLAPSTALLAEMHRLTQGRLPLVGVGGISGPADAYEKIRAGASLVQLYTALTFAGPRLVAEIKRGLAQLLRRDGFASIADAVGAGRDGVRRHPEPQPFDERST
jgi:dihydroorotate dehydrogenase